MSHKWIIYDQKGQRVGHIEKETLNPMGCLVVCLAIWLIGSLNSLFSHLFPASERLTRDSKVDFNGLGRVKIGMTVKEAEKAGKIKLVPVQGAQIKNQGCFNVKPVSFYGLQFMLTDGRISRIDVNNSYIKTVDDIGFNFSTSSLKENYRKKYTTSITPGKFEGQQYIEFISPKLKNRRIIFVANSIAVDSYAVGKLPEVRYRNGCKR